MYFHFYSQKFIHNLQNLIRKILTIRENLNKTSFVDNTFFCFDNYSLSFQVIILNVFLKINLSLSKVKSLFLSLARFSRTFFTEYLIFITSFIIYLEIFMQIFFIILLLFFRIFLFDHLSLFLFLITFNLLYIKIISLQT